MKIGVLGDTHGLLRPEAARALAGVDRILHLGDVGDFSILRKLEELAPVTAIRGNIDREGPCAALPETDLAIAEGLYIYMLHDLKTLSLDPAAAGFSAVLFGHTHQPSQYRNKGILYFNPGSCGPRRFEQPIALGLLTIQRSGEMQAEIVSLEGG